MRFKVLGGESEISGKSLVAVAEQAFGQPLYRRFWPQETRGKGLRDPRACPKAIYGQQNGRNFGQKWPKIGHYKSHFGESFWWVWTDLGHEKELVTLGYTKIVILKLSFGYKRKLEVADFFSSWSSKSEGLKLESSNKDKGFLILESSRAFLENLASKGVETSEIRDFAGALYG